MLKRGQVIQQILNPATPETDQDGFWENLCSWVRMGQVIPIISGSLFYDSIFNPDKSDCVIPEDDEPMPKVTVENMIAENWAQRLDYQFPDKQELARVAQYVRSKAIPAVAAKNEYLRYIKQLLLDFALTKDPSRSNEIKALNRGIRECSFSYLACQELELLKFTPEASPNPASAPEHKNPISILAQLPLPIYITTSYHDLLELALKSVGKEPITQVCFWNGDVSMVEEDHEPLRKLEPSPQRPLVYHLFGLEEYPVSLVLTEDDYLDFLVKITLALKGGRPVIPNYLRAALTTSSLMLLGYRLQDWDFRTLFRGLITAQENHTAGNMNTIIQLAMEHQYDHPASSEKIHKFFANVEGYLQNYFNTMSFEIRWSDPSCFLDELNQEWERRRR